jgi:hypothetical protein
LLRGLHNSCDGVLHFRDNAKRAGDDRKILAEQHPEFAGADLRIIAVHWIMVCLPLAIWLVDVCLLSAVSEYLATLMFPDRPQLVLAVRLLVAFAVVGVELGLAARLHFAYERADETENRLPYVLCWIGALVWAAFLSACLIATQQAAGAEEDASTHTLMYALAGFCFLLHLLIPFSHELLHEAKGYLFFHIRDFRLRSAERRARQGEIGARRDTTVTFQHYARDLNRHNGIHPQTQLLAGPFSVAVRTVINEIFGEGTIPAANRLDPGDAAAPGAAPAAPSPAPVTPASNAGARETSTTPLTSEAPNGQDAENDYLRTILTRRQRDEESEVRA